MLQMVGALWCLHKLIDLEGESIVNYHIICKCLNLKYDFLVEP